MRVRKHAGQFKFYNGSAFLNLKDYKTHHNQWSVTVVAKTLKRAHELICQYCNWTLGGMRQYWSLHNDSPPYPLENRGPFVQDGIWVAIGGDDGYRQLTPDMIQRRRLTA